MRPLTAVVDVLCMEVQVGGGLSVCWPPAVKTGRVEVEAQPSVVEL